MSNHNDIFSAFSNAVLMNRCAGHQIRVISQIEITLLLLVESAEAVIPCCLNFEAHLESLCTVIIGSLFF